MEYLLMVLAKILVLIFIVCFITGFFSITIATILIVTWLGNGFKYEFDDEKRNKQELMKDVRLFKLFKVFLTIFIITLAIVIIG